MAKYRFKVTSIVDVHGPNPVAAKEALFGWLQDMPTEAQYLKVPETIVYLIGKHKNEKVLDLETN